MSILLDYEIEPDFEKHSKAFTFSSVHFGGIISLLAA